MKSVYIGLAIFFLFIVKTAQAQTPFVDSLMQQMTLEQKIAQLMIVRVPSSDMDKPYPLAIENIRRGVGGICYFAGYSEDQLKLTACFQEESSIPLFVSIDGEWGLGMRIKDAYSFPKQLMLGAISEDTLIYMMGSEIALQCKKMGIHINFAPTCDINTNSENPVIGVRSFGDNREAVSKKSVAYVRGLQDNGVLAVAKHFPGHGDTEIDSHFDMPVLHHTRDRLDSIELYPFKQLILNNVGGIMIAHLQVPVYDTSTQRPSSLSFAITSELLREQLQYQGLIFTDGLEMQAVTRYFNGGMAELEALRAGVDILLLPANVETAISLIRDSAMNDTVLQKIIELRCRKILEDKYERKLFQAFSAELLSQPSSEDIKRAENLSKKIVFKALTLLKNKDNLLPLGDLSSKKIVCLSIDGKNDMSLKKSMSDFVNADFFSVNKPSTKEVDSLLKSLSQYDTWIISISGSAFFSKKTKMGFSPEGIDLLDSLQRKKPEHTRMIVAVLGLPYLLTSLEEMQGIDAILVGYEDYPFSSEAVVQAIMGSIPLQGKLPVEIGSFSEGFGISTLRTRFSFSEQDEVTLSKESLAQIDSIALGGIKAKAYPGCRVFIARKGEVLYDRSYGKMTYDSTALPITDTTIFDIASVTKIAATTLAVMKLVDMGLLQLDAPLSNYLPYLKGTDKDKISIKQVLSHCAGLKAYMPFWKGVQKDPRVMGKVLVKNPSDTQNFVPLTDSLFIRKEYKKALIDSIVRIPLNPSATYLYSDFGFILLGDLVERLSAMPLDVFMEKYFYQPLGMRKTSFNPLSHGFNKEQIAPTECDSLFRMCCVQAYVHDPTAALMGGVAGHAGLFSTAQDLAIICQMLLNGGSYGGQVFLSPECIETFNTRYFTSIGNRRALGFDKPLTHGVSSHVSPHASSSSYGHTGFTGTMIWVDPESELIYIFLSNRVYPDAVPNKLAQMDIRTRIQNVIYRGIKNSKGIL